MKLSQVSTAWKCLSRPEKRNSDIYTNVLKVTITILGKLAGMSMSEHSKTSSKKPNKNEKEWTIFKTYKNHSKL